MRASFSNNRRSILVLVEWRTCGSSLAEAAHGSVTRTCNQNEYRSLSERFRAKGERWRRGSRTERMGRAGTNAIQYEIAALSKFMTIYTHCMPDAVGVRVALAASRSMHSHILITSIVLSVLLCLSTHMRVHVSRYRGIYCFEFFLLPFTDEKFF